MKKFFLILLSLFFIFSCEIKSAEKIVGKWKYQVNDKEFYSLVISKGGKCTLSQTKNKKAGKPIQGTIKVIDGNIVMFFGDKGLTRRFKGQKGVGELTFINLRNPKEVMIFKKDKGGKK